MKTILLGRVQRIVSPVYDELTLFALGYTCLLLAAGGVRSLYVGGNLAPTANGAVPVLLVLIVGCGVCLSLFHAVSRRKKGRLEKQVMFIFAVIMNAFSGIWGGTYLLSRADGWHWVLIFPLVNIVTSYLLIVETRHRQLDETCIDDRDARPGEIALSALFITLAFALAHLWKGVHWAATLSLCVFYGTNLNRVIVNLLLPARCR